MERHITILSVLFIIMGIIGLIFAAVIFFLGAGAVASILSQDNSSEAQVAAGWAGGCMTFVAALIGVLSIPSIIAGWGLSKRKAWARILTLVIGALNLPNMPIGTAIGLYAIIIMMNDETKRLLIR
jgi:hypothetical protein